MGRLNYTNRKTEGVKLGQSIARDLGKRIPPGTAYKAALRDPMVELDVTGKALGEEGFLAFADVLMGASEYDGEHGRVLHLEELCLKSNKLNVSCLPALARIVRLAAFDLRDLDLSDNQFTVMSIQDADAWQEFLGSFGDCCLLRRVDLSGNALGARAFEVLARVYTRQPIIDWSLEDDMETMLLEGTPSRRSTSGDMEALNRQTRNLSLGSAFETHIDDEEPIAVTGHNTAHGIRHDSKSPEKLGLASDVEAFRRYKTTQGLRSIPYLILSDTGMTDTGALHLSYIVACHYHPHRLRRYVPSARSAHHIHQLDFYDKESGCQGIIYLPNHTFSGSGHKLLELCEGARFSLLDEDAPTPSPEVFGTHFRKTSTPRKTSLTQSSPSMTAPRPRRRSGTKGEQDELPDNEAVSVELDRARSRIQGNVLRDDGVQSNDLWRTALQMLSLCRMICPLRKQEPQLPAPSAHQAAIIPIQPIATPDVPVLPKQNPKSFVGYLDPFAPPLAPKSPNMPVTPSPKSRKQSLKLKTTTPSPLSFTTSPTSPTSPGASGLQPKPYRSDLPRGLPEEAWARVMGLHLEADRLLTRTQQCNVMRWAVDRKTLEKELESLGKPESAQIWKVLDGMGCLAYESEG